MKKIKITNEQILDTIIMYSRKGSKFTNLVVEIALKAPYFNSKPIKGLNATFYCPRSYEGDLEQFERLRELVLR